MRRAKPAGRHLARLGREPERDAVVQAIGCDHGVPCVERAIGFFADEKIQGGERDEALAERLA